MRVGEKTKTAHTSLAAVKATGLYEYICSLWDIKQEARYLGVRSTTFSASDKKIFSSSIQFSRSGLDLAVRKLAESDEAERCELTIAYLFLGRGLEKRQVTRYELVIVK